MIIHSVAVYALISIKITAEYRTPYGIRLQSGQYGHIIYVPMI